MVAATAWLDLVGSTAVYWGLHTMIKTRMPRELVRALRDSQRVQRFEVTPRRLALKLCGAVQVIVAFVLGVLVVRDVTRPPPLDDIMAAIEPRVRVSWLLLPVRSGGSPYTERAVLLTAGFWVFAAVSDVRRLVFALRHKNKLARENSALLLASHAAPLIATFAFVRWRARFLEAVAAARGGGSGGSFGTGSGDSHLDNGLGFPDLLVACLLCALLPTLLANTRWIVHAIDPLLAENNNNNEAPKSSSSGRHGGKSNSRSSSSSGGGGGSTFEARFLDAAVAVNTFVCRVLVWPFMLLMHHRHQRGGLRDPDEYFDPSSETTTTYGGLLSSSNQQVGGGILEEVPLLEAVVDALLTLPLRCSIGTTVLFCLSVHSFQQDARRAFARSPSLNAAADGDVRKTNNSSSSSNYRGSDRSSSKMASQRPPKLLSNLERGGEYSDPISPGLFPSNDTNNNNPGGSSSNTTGEGEGGGGGGGGGGGNTGGDNDVNDDDGDSDLPPALLRLASTPEELEWLRAQKRISRALKKEQRRSDALGGGGDSSDQRENDAPLRPIGARKWD